MKAKSVNGQISRRQTEQPMLSPGSVSDSHRCLCLFLLAPDSSPEAANQVSVLPGKASLLDMGGRGRAGWGLHPRTPSDLPVVTGEFSIQNSKSTLEHHLCYIPMH